MLNKFFKGFVFAGKGVAKGVGSGRNMKIHLLVTILVVIFGFIFSISLTEWMLCVICMGLVIGMELLNTAIEKTIDIISPSYNPKAGEVKDLAAGAVLVCAVASAIVGFIIFLPKIVMALNAY